MCSSDLEEIGRQAYGHRPEVGEADMVEEQRDLTVPAYGMARYPITQAQWRSLAGEEHKRQGGANLQPDPSQHKNDDGPVDSVSWHDAQEWLLRLNRWLQGYWQKEKIEGRPPVMGLPSESLWELACRAGSGSSTPFHFGDTLDAAWANYNGN